MVYAMAVSVSREQSLTGTWHERRGSMVPMRSVVVLEMRALGFLDRPSDAGIARARDAKERKAKRVILAGENMADWYGRKNTARDAKAKQTGARALQNWGKSERTGEAFL